jgi:hypothetical protein
MRGLPSSACVCRQPRRLDTNHGTLFIAIRMIAADADCSQDGAVAGPNQDAAGHGNDLSAREDCQGGDESRMRGGALCQRPRTHSHSQGSPCLRLGDLWAQQARSVFALQCYEAARRIEYGDRKRLKACRPRMFTGTVDDNRRSREFDHGGLLVHRI